MTRHPSAPPASAERLLAPAFPAHQTGRVPPMPSSEVDLLRSLSNRDDLHAFASRRNTPEWPAVVDVDAAIGVLAYGNWGTRAEARDAWAEEHARKGHPLHVIAAAAINREAAALALLQSEMQSGNLKAWRPGANGPEEIAPADWLSARIRCDAGPGEPYKAAEIESVDGTGAARWQGVLFSAPQLIGLLKSDTAAIKQRKRTSMLTGIPDEVARQKIATYRERRAAEGQPLGTAQEVAAALNLPRKQVSHLIGRKRGRPKNDAQ
jgi:hypothetical protein